MFYKHLYFVLYYMYDVRNILRFLARRDECPGELVSQPSRRVRVVVRFGVLMITLTLVITFIP